MPQPLPYRPGKHRSQDDLAAQLESYWQGIERLHAPSNSISRMRVAILPPFRGYVQVCVRSEVTVKLGQAPLVTSTGEAVLPGGMPRCPYLLGSARPRRVHWPG